MDAHAMLRSRDFGSSGDESTSYEQQHGRGHGQRTRHQPYDASSGSVSASQYDQEDITNENLVDQQGLRNDLGSFEDSFVPSDPAENKENTRQTTSNIRLPKTPQLFSRTLSNAAARKNVITDAAGFVKQNGRRGVFEQDDAIVNDLSQVPGGGNSTRQDTSARDYDDELGQPSFERSESQSMQVVEDRKRAAPAPRERKDSGRSQTASSNGMSKSTASKQNLTLREQEKVIDDVKKENFSLKLKIYFLEERLAKLAPEHVDSALKEHIDLQVEYQNTRTELKKHKKLLLNAQKALDEMKEIEQQANGRMSRHGLEAQAEIERLREELRQERAKAEDYKEERDSLLGKVDELANHAEHGSGLEREIQQLEKENASLRSQVNAQVTMLATRNEEKDHLYEEMELLKQDVVALEGELQRAQSNTSQENQDRLLAGLEDELNSYKDKLSANLLDFERREKEIRELNHELDQREAEHEQELVRAAEEWKVALDEARRDRDHLADVLEERDQEIKELDKKLDELDALAQEDQTRIEKAVQVAETKDKEVAVLGEEVVGLAEDLQKLGKQIENLEDELDEKTARITDLERDLDAADKAAEDKQTLHQQITSALKEKLATSKAKHTDLTIQNESLTTEVGFLRGKVEDLAFKHAELEEARRSDEKQLRAMEAELQDTLLASKRDKAEVENHWKGILSEKDQQLNSIRRELRETTDRLGVREQDLARLNEVLRDVEDENKKADEDHTTNKMSLILEVERLNRDLAHYEADLDHARSQLERQEEEIRQKDMDSAMLRVEKNDLAAQLAQQTQSRLHLSDKLDTTSKALRDVQRELSTHKEKLRGLEVQSSSSSRNLNRTNADYQNQLSERNALLQHVYQAIEKVVGVDRRKSIQGDLKPHTNFTVFHDSLVSRLRAVSQIQNLFDRRARDMEGKFVDQMSILKRQVDTKLKQVDRCETSLKAALDSQKQWKQRVLLKQGEVEAVKGTNSELSHQISSLKSQINVADMSPGTSHKIQTLAARASAAEKRLAATQAQLHSVEEKLLDAKTKTGLAEDQWEARFRELMNRYKAAEEKVKRERQGAKERVRELEQTIAHLQQQITGASTRSSRLAHVLNQ